MDGLAHPAGSGVPITLRLRCGACEGTGRVRKGRSVATDHPRASPCDKCSGHGRLSETVLLAPLTARDLGTLENHLVMRRRNPLDVARKVVADLPPALAEKLLERAYTDALKQAIVSREEMAAWSETMEGLAYTVWMSLRKNYGDRFKLGVPGDTSPNNVWDILEAMDDAALDKIKNARDLVTGQDELGNSVG